MKKLILIFLVFLTLGCSTINQLTDFGNPEVSSSYPANGSNAVSNDATIMISFDEEMDKGSVNKALTFVGSSGDGVAYYTQWNGSKKIYIYPEREMITGEQYTLSVAETAKDRVGNRLTIPYILTFTVNADQINPTILEIYVEGYNEDHGAIFIPGDTTRPEIRIEFSEEMNIEKTYEAIQFNNLKINPIWQDSPRGPNSILVAQVIEDVKYGAQCGIIIGKNIEDKAGNKLKKDENLNFLIGHDFDHPVINQVDIQTFISNTLGDLNVDPANNTDITYGIYNKTNIVIHFADSLNVPKAMSPAAVEAALSISPDPGKSLVWSNGNTILTIKLDDNKKWDYGQLHTLKISTDATDAVGVNGGNKLLTELVYQFVIGDDHEKPEVSNMTVQNTDVDLNPQNLMTGNIVDNVFLNPYIKIYFTKDMDTVSVQENLTISNIQDESNLVFSWANNNRELTIYIQEKLVFGTLYEVEVTESATALIKELSLNKSYKGSFRVGVLNDYLRVEGNILYSTSYNLNPMDDPDSVALNPSISISFNKEIDINSFDGNVIVSRGSDTPIKILKKDMSLLNADRTLHINLIDMDKKLVAGVLYKLTISEIVHANVNNLEAPLAEDYETTFTTAASEEFKVTQVTIDTYVNEALTNDPQTFLDGSGEKLPFNSRPKISPPIYNPNGKYSIIVTIQLSQDINIDSYTKFDTQSNVKLNRLDGNISPYIKSYDFTAGSNIIKIEYADIDFSAYYSLVIKGEDMGLLSTAHVPMKNDFSLTFTTFNSTIMVKNSDNAEYKPGFTYDFGDINIGNADPVPMVFTIENLKDAVLNLTGTPIILIDKENVSDSYNPNDFFEVIQPADNVIAANGSVDFTVNYKHNSVIDSRYAKLIILNSSTDRPYYVIHLKGTGVSP